MFSYLLLASTAVLGQTPTVVTGQAKDSNGLPYAFASVQAQLVGCASSGCTIVSGGIPVQIQGQQNATADVNGNFSMNLYCNSSGGGCSAISPAATQWKFTINETGTPPPIGTGPQTCAATLTISGASQSVSSSFSACPALSNVVGNGAFSGIPACTGFSPTNGQTFLYTTTSSPNPCISPGNGGNGAQTNVANTFTAPQTFDDIIPCGPNPRVDVRCYGARAVNQSQTPAIAGITVTCTSGVNTVTLSGSPQFAFQVGDGVVLYGCGASNALGSPTAPTVTPAIASSVTGSGTVVAAPAASTTYQYEVVWRDAGQGLTAASSAGTTSTGQASLGEVSTNITNASISTNTVTVNSGTQTLSTGALIFQSGVSDVPDFGGWYILASAPSSSQYTYTQGRFVANGLANPAGTSTGGTVIWYNCNDLTLTPPTNATQGYIYKFNGTNYALYGVTTPVDSGLASDGTYMHWDDFGSTMMGGINLPAFLPATAPASATADSLVTTITAINGLQLTLQTAPTTNLSGATIRFDNAPNILTAMNNARNTLGGMVDFPVSTANYLGCYVVNSPIVTPANTMVSQEGSVCLFDTMTVSGGSQWYGDKAINGGNGAPSCPQFSITCHTNMSFLTANPGVKVSAGVVMNGLAFVMNGNAYLGIWSGANSGIPASTFDNDSFVGTSNDYMGILFYGFCPTSEAAGFHFQQDSFYSALTQTDGLTATPLVMFKNCGEVILRDFMVNRRGFYFSGNGAGTERIDQGYETQGPIMPFVMLGGNTAAVEVRNAVLDTGSHALVANFGTTNNVLRIHNSGAPSNGFAMVTGNAFAAILHDGSASPVNMGQNAGVFNLFGGNRANLSIGPANSFFTDPGQLSTPTCTTVTAGPPFTPSGTYNFMYTASFPNGGSSAVSAVSGNCTADGVTQQINVNGAAVAGANSYAWWFGNDNLPTLNAGGCAGVQYPHTNSFTYTGSVCGFSTPPNAATGGPVGIDGNATWTLKLTTTQEATLTQCFSSATPAACGSNIDGFVAIPAGSSSVVVDTSAVTANSEINLTFDATQGANLSVTCNTTPQQPYVSARTAGTSFTVAVPANFSTNPGCIGFHLKN